MKDNDKLSEVIKNARINKNLSQRQLAKNINVDNATISRIENETVKQPAIDILLKLSKELEIEYIKLLKLANYDTEELFDFSNYESFENYDDNNNRLLNYIDNDKLQLYLSENNASEYIDIIKVLNGYKYDNLALEETLALIYNCEPIEIDDMVIFPSENNDIYLYRK